MRRYRHRSLHLFVQYLLFVFFSDSLNSTAQKFGLVVEFHVLIHSEWKFDPRKDHTVGICFGDSWLGDWNESAVILEAGWAVYTLFTVPRKTHQVVEGTFLVCLGGEKQRGTRG